ncbi:MAG: DUF87 domain-containing protein, partial [Candidatus Bathyarchaeia archaeon]
MDFEKLGSFYLGKEYDLAEDRLLDRIIMLDARDLTTHALCVGMTGSGKTGLCISILEEAAIDHVPAIIVDPKGDITNLLLTFPELRPEDFRPWINEDDARRKSLDPDQYASQQAELWRNGLAQWGESGSRIRMLRDSVDYVIYTPGSDAGVPVSILQSFAAPALSWETDAELLRERVQGTVSALLALVGVQADPVRSREHILLANLFEYFWRRGEDLDLTKLILSIQNPPIRQLGVFDVDTFYPPKDRFELAMKLNSLVAAPNFQTWLRGQPLDIPGFLYTPDGKTRHSIFYIAHLNDSERMFFVTMLLNQLITWMRAQPGTTSLRALFYMDEIFGFFPPVANPPSKQPMLTLLKTARAFGLGIILTTQNPVDLDYKGLTNAGIWFIGRLQAERDKARLLDGLESASAQASQRLNREKIDRIISSLKNRVFLLHNVREEAPIVFQTRWAMSYLRGPLTREQVRVLMGDRGPDGGIPAKIAPRAVQAQSITTAPLLGSTTSPPIIDPKIRQVYLPIRKGATEARLEIERKQGSPVKVKSCTLIYRPAIIGMGRINFFDARHGVNETEDYALLAYAPTGAEIFRWDGAQNLNLAPRDLIDRPEPEAEFEVPPTLAERFRDLSSAKRDLVDYLSRTSNINLLYSPVLKIYSKPKESERDFRARLTQLARERRDAEVDKLSQRYEDRLRKLQDRLRRAQEALDRREAEAKARKGELAVSVGESVLGMLMGRRSMRSASTAISKYRQIRTATMTVEQEKRNLEALRNEIKDLERELKDQTDAISSRWDEAISEIDTFPIRPSRKDITVDLIALAWAPHWQIAYFDLGGSVREESVQ